MILCRSCKRISPHRSRFCGNCSKSFGSKLCPKGHKNSVSAKCCTECANSELSTPTAYISVRPLTLVISILVALSVLKWSVAHLSEFAAFLLTVLDWTLSYVTGEDALSILFRLLHLLLLAFVPFLIWWAIIERFKTPSKSIGLYTKCLSLLGKYTFRLLAALFNFLFVRDKGKDRREKSERTEKKREDDFNSYPNSRDEE